MADDPTLYLAIDIGTGSLRAALVDAQGHILAIRSQEHEQEVPQHGWAQQRASGWWNGTAQVIREVLQAVPDAAQRIQAICACGQMHGTVLVDADGRPTLDAVPLWNDKRATAQAQSFVQHAAFATHAYATANPPTPAWAAFKLQWLKSMETAAYAQARTVLMPKDYINLRLCGERAMDWTDASLSYLMDADTRQWSEVLVQNLGLDMSLLPPLRSPLDILGFVNQDAHSATGLRVGTPVLVGAGDYPLSMLGSGVAEEGMGSDITGTSSILTLMTCVPLRHPGVTNVACLDGLWGRFMLLESGGDAIRWARRAFHENKLSYAELTALSEQAPAGSAGLFFLPYLTGERMGNMKNSRAQFFGLSAHHGLPHLHRAVMEGVAFGMRRYLQTMNATGSRIECIVAASGGAKSELWLRIKASMYQTSIAVPMEAESGIVGCAILAATACGKVGSVKEAARRFVHFKQVIEPDARTSALYARMAEVFDLLYNSAQPLYAALDELAPSSDRLP